MNLGPKLCPVTVLIIGAPGSGKRLVASHIQNAMSDVPRSESATGTPNPSLPSSQPQTASSTASRLDVRFKTAERYPFDDSLDLDGGDHVEPLTLLNLTGQPPRAKLQRTLDTTPLSVLRYDFVLIMVDMSNINSWRECKQTLGYLEPKWFLGRCAIVVTNVGNVAEHAFDREEIEIHLENIYEIPIMWCNLDQEHETRMVGTRTRRMLELATGFVRNQPHGMGYVTTASFVRTPETYSVESTLANPDAEGLEDMDIQDV